MKSILYLFVVITFLSCNNFKKEAAIAEALSSGIVVDTIICGICFNDSPEEVKRKIQEWSYFCPGNEFTMHFTYPERINQYAWEIDTQWYYNDSLYNISIKSEIPSYKFRECMEDLDSLFTHKYGKSYSSRRGKELNWYKGNLTISITVHKDLKYVNDYISISYNDNRYYNKRAKGNTISKYSEDYNIYHEYNKEYWDRTYKQEEEEKLHKATKNI